jgi:hypothetical protein
MQYKAKLGRLVKLRRNIVIGFFKFKSNLGENFNVLSKIKILNKLYCNLPLDKTFEYDAFIQFVKFQLFFFYLFIQKFEEDLLL